MKPANEEDTPMNFPQVSDETVLSNTLSKITMFQKNSDSRLSFLSLVNRSSSSHIKSEYTIKIEDIPVRLREAQSSESIKLLSENINTIFNNEIPINFIKEQIEIILNDTTIDYGSKLIFATYINSISLISEIITFNKDEIESKHSFILAEKAIKLLSGLTLPPLFYPKLSEASFLTINTNEIMPSLPTALTTNDTMAFVGTQTGDVKIIPLKGNAELLHSIIIPNISNQKYSMVHLNGFLVFSTDENHVILHDMQDSIFELPVSYVGHFFAHGNSFAPPIVTDGMYLYSISFGSSPRVKKFELCMDCVLFNSAIPLKIGQSELLDFQELLPIQCKNTALIATNGVYLSVILKRSKRSICRIFDLDTGLHLYDIPLPTAPIKAWTFDPIRPGHCLLNGDRIEFYESVFTIPPWQVGFTIPPPTKLKRKTTAEITNACTQTLARLAVKIIGADINFGIYPESSNFENSIETAVCYFLEKQDFNGVKAFLVFLNLKLSQNLTPSSKLQIVLQRLMQVMSERPFEELRPLTVYVFLSNLDVFSSADKQLTSNMLLMIIKQKQFTSSLFRFLPQCQFLVRALSTESLKALMEISLETTYKNDELAIALMTELLMSFMQSGADYKDLFTCFLQRLEKQFNADFKQFKTNQWSENRFTNSVSFITIHDCIKMIFASSCSQIYSSNAATIFFQFGANTMDSKVEIIDELSTRAQYLSFQIGFELIKSDKSFTFLPGAAKRDESEFDGFLRSLNITEKGVDLSLRSLLIRTAFDCCTIRTSPDEISNRISHILSRVASRKVVMETVLEKIQKISKILPQTFTKVFDYIEDPSIDEPNIVTSMNQSPIVRTIILFDEKLSPLTPVGRTILAMFINEFDNVKESFAVLPLNILKNFVENFTLRFFISPDLIHISGYRPDSKKILDLPTQELFSCGENLIEIADVIENKQELYKPMESIENVDIFNQSKRTELQRAVLLMEIASAGGVFANDLKFVEAFVTKCVKVGDYTVLKSILSYIELSSRSGIDNTSSLEYLASAVGQLFARKQNFFLCERNQFSCCQNAFLICDFFRRNLDIYRDFFIDLIKKGMYEDSLVVFAVMNNQIDVLRCGVIASFTSNKENIQDTVTFVDITTSKFNLKHSQKEYRLRDINDLHPTSNSFFDVNKFMENFDGEIISKLFIDFNCTHPMHNVLKYASLMDFCESDKFKKEIAKPDFVEEISKCISFVGPRPEFLYYKFSQTFQFLFDQIPSFSFSSSPTSDPLENLSPATHNILRTISKVSESESKVVTNKIMSFDNPITFISSPIHLHRNSNLTIISTREELCKLSVSMVGSLAGMSFQEVGIEFSKAEISIDCSKNILTLKTDTKNVRVYLLEPACDMLFIELTLAPKSVVSYKFEIDCNISHSEDVLALEAKIMPARDSQFEIFPFELSQSYFNEHRSTICSQIISNFAQIIMMRILPYIEYKYDHVGNLVLSLLESIDNNPLSDEILIPEKCDEKQKEIYDFVRNLSSKLGDSIVDLCIEAIDKSLNGSMLGGVSQALFEGKVPPRVVGSYVINKDKITVRRLKQNVLTENKDRVIVIPMFDISGSSLEVVLFLRHSIMIALTACTTMTTLEKCVDNLIKLFDKAVEKLPFDIVRRLRMLCQSAFTKSSKNDEIDKWALEVFKDFYEGNETIPAPDARTFFYHDHILKRYPLSYFVARLLGATSFEMSTVSMSQKMVYFQNIPEAEDEFIFLVIRVSDADKALSPTFEVSHKDTFEDVIIVPANHYQIISPESFFIRSRGGFDMMRAQFFWKTFDVSSSGFPQLIEREIFEWRAKDSAHLLGSLMPGEHLTSDLYSVMPLSARFSYDTAAFFASVLAELELRPLELSESIKRHFERGPNELPPAISNSGVSDNEWKWFSSLVGVLRPPALRALKRAARDAIIVVAADPGELFWDIRAGIFGVGQFESEDDLVAAMMRCLYQIDQ